METNKDIQKIDRKESEAGLAAGIELENKTTQDADATKKMLMEQAEKEALKAAAEKIAKAAGEAVLVQITLRPDGGTFLVIGSEIACLRVAYTSRNLSKRPEVGFFPHLQKWFCLMEVAVKGKEDTPATDCEKQTEEN